MLQKKNNVLATLPAPNVAGAVDGTLDPQTQGPKTKVSLRVYNGMKTKDEILLFLIPPGASARLLDKIMIRASQGETEPAFHIASSEFERYLGASIGLSYEVWFGTQRLHTSQPLRLDIKAGFEGEKILDLSSFNYVVVTGKPPQNPPAFSRFTREATWGVAPYEYSSSDDKVAVVDPRGEVTVSGNGQCLITATDSVGQSQKYSLTVSGIGQLSFLTDTANWAGMHAILDRANLKPASLPQLRQLLNIYRDHAGSLTQYLGRLPYPFWTGDPNGANTAWIVDLDKPQDDPLDPNPTSADLSEVHQLLGTSMS